jgi:hypothetical protein
MQAKSLCALALASALSVLIAIPADLGAVPQAAGQHAGEISRVIPAANIERGSKSFTAAPKSAVDWQDLVNTQVNGRARVALDDGSVLNVGSQSALRVEKHDAGTQQTQLDLTYGKLRSQAQKISQPDGKFEVHTPAGVAGVVGTDFYVGYDNGVMNVIAFEGIVRVCNLAGVCVLVKAGQTTSSRNNDNSGPAAPTQASLDLLMEAVNATRIEDAEPGVLRTAGPLGGHPGLVMGIVLGVVAAVPIAIIPTFTKSSSKAPAQVVVPPFKPVTAPTTGCTPGNPAC